MIPVVSSEEMVRLDQLALSRGCSEEAFMKEAGNRVSFVAQELVGQNRGRISFLIGKGNKGGDGFVAACRLLERGFAVRALAFFPMSQCSRLNRKFWTEFVERGGGVDVVGEKEVLSFDADMLIVDALFGTGFQGKIDSFVGDVIAQVNGLGKMVLSIDLPSGLHPTTGVVKGPAIIATHTVSLGLFKTGCFLQEGWNHVGKLRLERYGLPEEIVAEARPEAQVVDLRRVLSYFPKIVRNRNKYQAGYLLGLGGSTLFQGAPHLAGLGALRSGSGMVRLFSFDPPRVGALSLICQKWDAKIWREELKRADALFLGPGLGNNRQRMKKVKEILRSLPTPVVVDADAIQSTFSYPKKAILTPHRGEALRLFGISSKGLEEEKLFALCQKWVDRNDTILVLKGAPTRIFAKKELPILVLRGDPGMAKAGVGDVLTGIISSLLAQKVSPLDAAILGTSLHGTAGMIAAIHKSSYGMMAEDLIDALPHAIVEHWRSVIGFEPIDKAKNALL